MTESVYGALASGGGNAGPAMDRDQEREREREGAVCTRACASHNGGTPECAAREGASRRQPAREAAARTSPRALPVVPVRARGLTIEGADGHRCLDCVSGTGSLALGHNHPLVLEAIRRVLDSGAPSQVMDLTTPVEDAFVTEPRRTLPPRLADAVQAVDRRADDPVAIRGQHPPR
ncbi:hypothetical protein GCM10010424_00530 [Streptomyces lienomycini]